MSQPLVDEPTSAEALVWLQQSLSGLSFRYTEVGERSRVAKPYRIDRVVATVAPDLTYPDAVDCYLTLVIRDGGAPLHYTVAIGDINRPEAAPLVNTSPPVYGVTFDGRSSRGIVVRNAAGDSLRAMEELTFLLGPNPALAEQAARAMGALSVYDLTVGGVGC